MIRAILDTNVVVQSLISSPRSASVRTLQAYFDGRFRMIYSAESLDEVLDVLVLPRMRDRHGLKDTEILEFVASLLVFAESHSAGTPIPADVTRDATDTKYLSLAAEAEADFLVTNDRRHLLRLRKFADTNIVTPAAFLREL